MTRGRRWVAVSAAGLLLTACGEAGLPHGVTTQSHQTESLWKVFLTVAFIIGAIVYALIAFVVFRYRKRRRDDGTLPSQRQYVIGLEIFYTVVPIAIVAVLFGLSVSRQGKITGLSKQPDVVVEVTGFQWQWQFRYPASGIVVGGSPGVIPVLVVPTGETVRLKLASADVVHSFWVPHFLEKRDLIPGIDNQIDVRVDEPGQWGGLCSEFCGLDHYKMTFSVMAVTPQQFDAWLAKGGGLP